MKLMDFLVTLATSDDADPETLTVQLTDVLQAERKAWRGAEVRKESDRKSTALVCKNCRNAFVAKRSDKLFCSSKCRTAYYFATRKAVKAIDANEAAIKAESKAPREPPWNDV